MVLSPHAATTNPIVASFDSVGPQETSPGAFFFETVFFFFSSQQFGGGLVFLQFKKDAPAGIFLLKKLI